MAPFDGKFETSYLMAIVMRALSLTIYEIFANQIKCKKLTLKMKVKVKKEKNWTCANRAMFDSILIFFGILAAI